MNIFVNPGNQHADKYLFGGGMGSVFTRCRNAMGSVNRNIATVHKTYIARGEKALSSLASHK